jgi:hypothetical protein
MLMRKGAKLPETQELFDSLSRLREFTVTDDHLKLLRHMWVCWIVSERYGAPAIESKKPYGNSAVLADVAEILHGPDGVYEWTDQEAERYLRLHVETAIALQIALATGEFRPGRYRRKDYIGWKRDNNGL